MSKVVRIQWNIETAPVQDAGTNSRVSAVLMRDLWPLVQINLEPGWTTRLDRGTMTNLYWQFRDPDPDDGLNSDGTMTTNGNVPEPYSVSFPNGVKNHLQVFLQIRGDDAWRLQSIESYAISIHRETPRNSIDTWNWVETQERFHFTVGEWLSTDHEEGYTGIMLTY